MVIVHLPVVMVMSPVVDAISAMALVHPFVVAAVMVQVAICLS